MQGLHTVDRTRTRFVAFLVGEYRAVSRPLASIRLYRPGARRQNKRHLADACNAMRQYVTQAGASQHASHAVRSRLVRFQLIPDTMRQVRSGPITRPSHKRGYPVRRWSACLPAEALRCQRIRSWQAVLEELPGDVVGRGDAVNHGVACCIGASTISARLATRSCSAVSCICRRFSTTLLLCTGHLSVFGKVVVSANSCDCRRYTGQHRLYEADTISWAACL